MTTGFNPQWRLKKSSAFDLGGNSTAGKTISLPLWNQPADIYANANFSIYSAQKCNARCLFCIEEIRPASRGVELAKQKQVEQDEDRYFSALEDSLNQLIPLAPTLSLTGGEPSIDPRLPRIMQTMGLFEAKRRTMTTNGSGLMTEVDGKTAFHWLKEGRLTHLNISRAHIDEEENRRLMRFAKAPDWQALSDIHQAVSEYDIRIRLSCALTTSGIHELGQVLAYIQQAKKAGIDHVIFRQLMKVDDTTMLAGEELIFSNKERVELTPMLNQISRHPDFHFIKQVMGYYYYVEVWQYQGMTIVFEEADLARLEKTKKLMPGIIHELIFHPNAKLCSTWQPWDGILGPHPESTDLREKR